MILWFALNWAGLSVVLPILLLKVFLVKVVWHNLEKRNHQLDPSKTWKYFMNTCNRIKKIMYYKLYVTTANFPQSSFPKQNSNTSGPSHNWMGNYEIFKLIYLSPSFFLHIAESTTGIWCWFMRQIFNYRQCNLVWPINT